jgi:hypothetical protein
MAGIKIADLFARLGIEVDQRELAGAHRAVGQLRDEMGRFRKADPSPWVAKWNEGMASLRKSIKGVALGLGLGVGAAVVKGVMLNATVEDTKNQIAGMLALSKKTDLADQLGVADKLYANLQRRAASLPGTTAEYTQMLGQITQPVTAAGLGLQDLEDLAVNATVAAKALSISWDVAARDIGQALRGQFNSVDQLTGTLLGSMGYVGEKGRKRFNEMSAAQRGAVLKAALTQKQITQLAERQGQSFSGRLSQLQDAAAQFLARIGKGLFDALGPAIDRMSAWMESNQAAIQSFASTVGAVIAGAFSAIGAVIGWLIDHGDVARALLLGLAGLGATMAASWVIAAAPVIAVVAALTAVGYAAIKLYKNWGRIAAFLKTSIRGVGQAFAAVGRGLAAPFIAAWDFIVDGYLAMVDGFKALAAFIAAPFLWAADGIKSIIAGFVNFFIDRVNNVIWLANKTIDAMNYLPGVDIDKIKTLDHIGSEPTRMPTASAAGATTNNVSTTINVNGARDPRATGEEVRRIVREEREREYRASEGG